MQRLNGFYGHSASFRPRTTQDGTVSVPAWRVDIKRQVDLIEEVGRHYGFENLPSTFPGSQQAPRPSDPRIARDRRVRNAVLAMGFSEAITFAFIDEKAAAPFLADNTAVTIANPLSEKFTTMRPSLVPGLIRRGQPQPAPRAARCAPLRDRHAVLSHRRDARRRTRVDRIGHARSLGGRATRGGFRRHQGRLRATRGCLGQ
jgi:hypothetical protein